MTRVTRQHLRELGYCHKAVRPWFAERGLDWADFLENGIEIEVLREKGDHLSDRVVEHALKEFAARSEEAGGRAHRPPARRAAS
ncbi:MAG: hypothetical protein AAGC81_02415 [Pseudomonadota bacterium]